MRANAGSCRENAGQHAISLCIAACRIFPFISRSPEPKSFIQVFEFTDVFLHWKINIICKHTSKLLLFGTPEVETRKKQDVWEELIPSFPLTRHVPHRKRRLQQFFVVGGTSLLSCYLAAIRGYTDRPTDSPLKKHGPHRKRRPTIILFLRVFAAEGACIPSRCLVPNGG
jgi:hypothetical protein